MSDQSRRLPRAIDPHREYLTVKDVAARLTIRVSTVWRQVKHGTLPKPVRFGGDTRWRKADIEAFTTEAAA